MPAQHHQHRCNHRRRRTPQGDSATPLETGTRQRTDAKRQRAAEAKAACEAALVELNRERQQKRIRAAQELTRFLNSGMGLLTPEQVRQITDAVTGTNNESMDMLRSFNERLETLVEENPQASSADLKEVAERAVQALIAGGEGEGTRLLRDRDVQYRRMDNSQSNGASAPPAEEQVPRVEEAAAGGNSSEGNPPGASAAPLTQVQPQTAQDTAQGDAATPLETGTRQHTDAEKQRAAEAKAAREGARPSSTRKGSRGASGMPRSSPDA